MKDLICSNPDLCIGCNRCTRVCPIETANVTYVDEHSAIKVKIDSTKCIACGACITACKHGAREYIDDTHLFLEQLRKGEAISLFVAPAIRSSSQNVGQLLTWLRQLGVQKIYDVSLGADICTWAHIRYIQRHHPGPIITQPCPVIVNYCTMYKPSLLPSLSPIHSPMLCAAIYMKQYQNITHSLAALSPCIAKAHEFDATHLVKYNITFAKLFSYIEDHHIVLPTQESGFDHYPSGLGSVFAMPGGLKENIEFFLGKSLRIDKCEGQETVYKALDLFSVEKPQNLPDIFDVLNCPEGCNLGTGCAHEKNIFEVNTAMDKARKNASMDRDDAYFHDLYDAYDRDLRLEHFTRRYTSSPVRQRTITQAEIEKAFALLGKETSTQRNFDCGACGSDTCLGMARKVALHVNIPGNCIQKTREDITAEHTTVLSLQRNSLSNMSQIQDDIKLVKNYADIINVKIGDVNTSLQEHDKMVKIIKDISVQINIISLNASIEASRAGIHGKTFNVIASEIRRLANTSKDTMSHSEEVTQNTAASVQEMNRLLAAIQDAVQASYTNITLIHDSTQELLTDPSLGLHH